MRASEMTNDELANFLDTLSALSRDDDKLREAAARLRNVTISPGNSGEVAELRECLRKAVDVICEDCDATDDFGNLKCKNCKWRKALEGAKWKLRSMESPSRVRRKRSSE